MRREMAKSLLGFSYAYLSKGMPFAAADFHRAMIREIGDPANRRLEVLGFRSSAKSYYGSLALPLWAALEHPEKYPFIILIGDRFSQASLTIANLKNELDHNLGLKADYGVVAGGDPERWKLEGSEWQKQNLVLSNGVRIIARSRGQRIRGMRHLNARPSLVVVDDPEDLEWVKSKQNRDKSFQWLTSEIIPAMDERTGKLLLIGNLLHSDGLLSRMKPRMQKVLEYPLVKDYQGTDWKGMWDHCTWKAKYPTPESLEEMATTIGPSAWAREYLLRIVPEERQIVKPEDIRYYDASPKSAPLGLTGHGIDLAFTQKESSDFTAIVSGDIYYVDAENPLKQGNTPKIFVRPNPFHEKFFFYDVVPHLKELSRQSGSDIFYVEANGTQIMAVTEMEQAGLPVKPMYPKADKRARLQVIAQYIKRGLVLFPRTGCEELLQEIFGLGAESNDDLVDGLVYLVMGLVEDGFGVQKIWWI